MSGFDPTRQETHSATPRRRQALLGALVVTPLTVGLLAAGSGVAAAQDTTAGDGIVTNCGIVTCSDYVSRQGTREMLALLDSPESPEKLLSSTTCTLAGGKRSPVCKFAKVAIRFGSAMTRRTLTDAVDRNACYKTTYVERTGLITHVSTNNGTYCTDR